MDSTEGPRVPRAKSANSLAPAGSTTRSADHSTLHTARMSAGVSSPQFVGRAKELAALSDALAGAADGNPSVAMVLGASGVGKTRLVTEFGDGARALTCACSWATASSSRPGISRSDPWPRSSVTSSGRSARIGSRACSAGLGTSSPVSRQRSLRATLPRGLTTTRRSGCGCRLAPGAVAAVRPAVGRAEPDQPREADGRRARGCPGRRSATRDLIAFLLHNFRDERMLLILTFRTEHLPRGHALLGWIAELGRHPRTTMLGLAPLSPEETSIKVEAILGTTADAQLAARIYRRSGGSRRSPRS